MVVFGTPSKYSGMKQDPYSNILQQGMQPQQQSDAV